MIEKVYSKSFKYPEAADFSLGIPLQDDNESDCNVKRPITVAEVDKCAEELLHACSLDISDQE